MAKVIKLKTGSRDLSKLLPFQLSYIWGANDNKGGTKRAKDK